MKTVYDFKVQKTSGEVQPLTKYEGKPLIIVNTASKCGFTPQFAELQELYEKYQNKGLQILGFPCDQFNNQEFESQEETISFCTLNYGVSFPMYAKIDVKGPNAHPLFQFLTKKQKGFLTDAIKWNFTKFLIDQNGKVVKRYAPQTSPRKIETDLLQIL